MIGRHEPQKCGKENLTERQLLAALQSLIPSEKYAATTELEVRVRRKEITNIRPFLPTLRAHLQNDLQISEALLGILQASQKEECRVCIPEIVGRLNKFNDPLRIRLGCTAVLGRLATTSDKNALECLKNMLTQDKESSIRVEAALAIGALPGEKNDIATIALQNGEKDKNRRVSIACALGSWRFEQRPEIVENLIRGLNDSDYAVRIDAAGALGQLSSSKVPKKIEPKPLVKIQSALKQRLDVEERDSVKFWIEEAIRVSK